MSEIRRDKHRYPLTRSATRQRTDYNKLIFHPLDTLKVKIKSTKRERANRKGLHQETLAQFLDIDSQVLAECFKQLEQSFVPEVNRHRRLHQGFVERL